MAVVVAIYRQSLLTCFSYNLHKEKAVVIFISNGKTGRDAITHHALQGVSDHSFWVELMRNHPVSETYSKIFGYLLFYHYLGSFTALTTDVEAGCGIFGVDSHTLEVEVLSFAIGNVGCYGVDSGVPSSLVTLIVLMSLLLSVAG